MMPISPAPIGKKINHLNDTIFPRPSIMVCRSIPPAVQVRLGWSSENIEKTITKPVQFRYEDLVAGGEKQKEITMH